MTAPLTVDNVSFDEAKRPDHIMVKKPIDNPPNNDPFDGEDLTLSDNSNSNSHSQHTTTNNSNHTTESNTNSISIIGSPIHDVDSKSNTELSDADDDDSASIHNTPPPPIIHSINDNDDDAINDSIINEIIAGTDHDNLNDDNNGNAVSSRSNNNIHHHVSRAYRKLLVHESERLKAENGRLLRKVEKMRCIRSSMQNIFDQLQENDEQLLSIEEKEEKGEEKAPQREEEEPLEIEHLNDLHHLERIRQNSHKQFILKQKQREERKKLRQERLLRFAQSRLQQQQIHYNNSAQIQNTNQMPHLAPFVPRICSTPACNHPLRAGGRSICCRGCLKKKHTAACTQRALKIIEKRRNNNNNNNNTHRHSHHHRPSTLNLNNGTRRPRAHSSSSVLNYSYYHRNVASNRGVHRRSHSVKYLFCDKCRSKFNCLSDLERHKSIHHSPVVAARMHSHSPTRNHGMPPPIPELTSSFHTTMPNQTANKFRYKATDNNDNIIEESMSRLGLFRKRKHSLSQLFNTFSRRNNNEEKDEKQDIEHRPNDNNKRRTLSALLNKRNDDEERSKMAEYRRKLEQRRQRVLSENKEEEKMMTPSNTETNRRRARGHRRSNATINMNIMPFITNSDNDEHDEEEKLWRPIPNNNNNNNNTYSDVDLAALRRKARDRKLRRNSTVFSVSAQHNNNDNPFRSHRSSFRTSSIHHPHRRASSHHHHHRYMRGSNINRPRLRQPFIPPNDDNASTSSSLYVNSNRDEEIARLLQQRDSLLQHFNDTIHPQHSNSFDINALRNRPRHRHSQSASNIVSSSRVDLTYLPIRCVQQSDIYKGSESSLNCSICQEKFKCGDKVKTLPCFHFFHVVEIDRWLTHSRLCPVCRHSIDHVNFK